MTDLAWLILQQANHELVSARHNGLTPEAERTTLEDVIAHLAMWRDSVPVLAKGASV